MNPEPEHLPYHSHTKTTGLNPFDWGTVLSDRESFVRCRMHSSTRAISIILRPRWRYPVAHFEDSGASVREPRQHFESFRATGRIATHRRLSVGAGWYLGGIEMHLWHPWRHAACTILPCGGDFVARRGDTTVTKARQPTAFGNLSNDSYTSRTQGLVRTLQRLVISFHFCCCEQHCPAGGVCPSLLGQLHFRAQLKPSDLRFHRVSWIIPARFHTWG
ncbi:hypothetical protein P154DRAFT_40621 [Amniculicola lignicola CBS 123094]|uniref:Uncharacterized protein n=1 Tax=Amniculicola lignicola CBS 123094 TaxID=1392246 RepID=A0A6A5VYK1_9PLEO|nr:hypothetical protein P154DRAFT_40621 [Amniculicola lignicola CBS 123094]